MKEDKTTLVRVSKEDRDWLLEIKRKNGLASIMIVVRRLLKMHGDKEMR